MLPQSGGNQPFSGSLPIAVDNTYTDFDKALAPVEHDGKPMIDARSLHSWLGVSARFNDWVRRRVSEYGLVEGEDFHSVVGKTRGRPRKDYLLTIDTAKELSMVRVRKFQPSPYAYF